MLVRLIKFYVVKPVILFKMIPITAENVAINVQKVKNAFMLIANVKLDKLTVQVLVFKSQLTPKIAVDAMSSVALVNFVLKGLVLMIVSDKKPLLVVIIVVLISRLIASIAVDAKQPVKLLRSVLMANALALLVK